MDFLIYLAFFLVACWAFFATVFAFQLYKENEDLSRRLGRIEPKPELSTREYLVELQTKVTNYFNDIYPKIKFTFVGFDKILHLIPLKIKFK